jgi:uncharacterized repeat protein (TIGR02543 family)
VNVSDGNGGTVQVNNAVLESYPVDLYYEVGVLVQLKAIPSPGYQFDGWSGDFYGNEIFITVEMNTDKVVTADFTIIKTRWGLIVGIILSVFFVGLAIIMIFIKRRHKITNS